VGHLVDRGRPDEAVAAVVAAARGVGDGCGHRRSELVGDNEGEQRLRQEARLEDAAAVLVCDPALPAVAYGLDHCHADVAGLLLDRVDHDLDPLAQHDGLDLPHRGHVPSGQGRGLSPALAVRVGCG
jgi:hypothetical protein